MKIYNMLEKSKISVLSSAKCCLNCFIILTTVFLLVDLTTTCYKPIRIAYKVFKPWERCYADIELVIFLHGLTGSKELWHDIPQIITNKTGRITYAYDARNHGESESTECYNFDLNVNDLFHFMEMLRIRKAILVGHSMGSYTATNAAVKKPWKFSTVFSEDTYIHKMPQSLADMIIQFITAFNKAVRSVPKNVKPKDALSVAADIVFQNKTDPASLADKESFIKSGRVLKRRPDGGYEVYFNKGPILKALKNAETLMTNPIGKFSGPSYFMYGDKSWMNVGSEKDHITKHFPQAELIEFEGASHNVHGEFPEKFTQTILSRLQQ